MKFFAIALFVLTILGNMAPATAEAAVVEVSVTDFQFTPPDVTINAGDTVRWVFASGPHTTTSGTNCAPDGLWTSAFLAGGGSFERTFTDPGVFPYFCDVGFHCESFGMQGSVTVNEAVAVLPLPEGVTVVPHAPVANPGLSENPLVATPIGFGSVAGGGDFLNFSVGFIGFAGPVDVYAALLIPAITSEIFIFDSSGALLPISTAGIVPWKIGQTDGFTQSFFGDIPVSFLPAGTYGFLVIITPSGTGLQTLTAWYSEVVLGP